MAHANPVIAELIELISQHVDFIATSPEQAREGLEQEGWFVAEDEDAAAEELRTRGWNIFSTAEHPEALAQEARAILDRAPTAAPELFRHIATQLTVSERATLIGTLLQAGS